MTTTESSTRVIPQTCVVPYRKRGDQIEFCLITSLKRKRWIFPKGIIDAGETLEQAALKEAFEEAGLQGKIVGKPLGSYKDTKWGRPLKLTVVLMKVTRSDDQWPESDARKRRWVEPTQAIKMLPKPEHRRFAKIAVTAIEPNSTK